MATYYIGTDVHGNNTELAIEQRGRIVARYSVPTTIPAKCEQRRQVQLKTLLEIQDAEKSRKI